MYGLLLEAIYDALKARHGEEIWDEIRQLANVEHHSFITHECYPEDTIVRLANAVSIATGTRPNEIMNFFGYHFVNYISRFGYDSILKVLGRHMRDFLNGLDNLHEYLRMSYPQMNSPSFFCASESRDGLIMHYRSKRRGFIHYVMGQIQRVGILFYNTEVEIEILEQEESNSGTHCVLALHFDNKAFDMDMGKKQEKAMEGMKVKKSVFFRAFPFHIVFSRNMVMRSIGHGLKEVIGNAPNQRLDHVFNLTKPPTEFTFEQILGHTNTMFELCSRKKMAKKKIDRSSLVHRRETVQATPTQPTISEDGYTGNENADIGLSVFNCDTEEETLAIHQYLRLKGQMRYMNQWDAFIFLGTPILENLDRMYEMGLFINDLSMHDVSRDLVMVGTEQSKELKQALTQQRQKSRKMEELMALLDMEMKRTDSLLYQMIPREVADSLRSGQPAVFTCRAFKSVTIMFSQVINFNEICMQITPLEVVSLLNVIYTQFDALTEKNKVYKVETIADAYMVAGGVPRETKHHALAICTMALDVMDSVKDIPNPAKPDSHIEVKLGIHSGAVVAGVVGMRMPRYCLFGDTVNTASRMESNSEGMKIHVSETTKSLIEDLPFQIEHRGSIQVKGKGTMETYWVSGDPNHERPSLPTSKNNSLASVSKSDPRRGSSISQLSYASNATFENIQKSHMSMRSFISASVTGGEGGFDDVLDDEDDGNGRASRMDDVTDEYYEELEEKCKHSAHEDNNIDSEVQNLRRDSVGRNCHSNTCNII